MFVRLKTIHLEQMFLTNRAVYDIMIMVPLRLKRMVTDGLPFNRTELYELPLGKGGW
jgi:hypothetical protein